MPIPASLTSIPHLPQNTQLRTAAPEDLFGIHSLLSEAGLPTEGTEASELFVLEQNGELHGVVGLERYGSVALLRSLAVSTALRGQGQGRLLMSFILEYAQQENFSAVYGLTTTIPDWLLRLGFTEITRHDLPAALNASQELQGACPTNARVFGQVLKQD